MDSYIRPPVDYLDPKWPPTRLPRMALPAVIDLKDIVPIALRALWLSRPTAERAESAKTFALAAAAWNEGPGQPVAIAPKGTHSPRMDPIELDAQMEMISDLIIRLVDAKPDDPELLATVAALQVSLEERAGPILVDVVRERFQCLLGSLGLIPSDNEGEACP
jgi:hypothetical protein